MAGHVQGIAWSQQEALANLSGMDRASPFLSRLDFVTAVANVAMAHRDEMHRKGPKGVLLRVVHDRLSVNCASNLFQNAP